MTTQDTMRLALEWIEAQPEPRMIGAAKIIKALKAALAQQREQQTNWVQLHTEADEIVRGSVLWKRFIDGTPLANDIACWMADFAMEYAGAAPAAQPLSIEEVEQINAQWNYEIHGDRTRYIARMVERSHGIGVQK